jgi:hypothetical protein
VSEPAERRPRTWVLWVVRAALALTVTDLAVGAIAAIWIGPRTGSFWWLVMALPQVSIALLAVLICWAPDSRPDGLELNVGGLIVFGLIFALPSLSWLPIIIGALTILALIVRPQPRRFITDGPPPRVGWPQR